MASKGKRKRAKRISPLRPPLPSRHSINHSRHVGSQHARKERIRGKGKESPPLLFIQNVKTRKKEGDKTDKRTLDSESFLLYTSEKAVVPPTDPQKSWRK